MPQKDPVINILKGMAIVLVVYGHVIQRTLAAQGSDFYLDPVFKFIYTFHMPLFFFISGYLMAWTLDRRSPADALASRCRTLLVPYLSWGVLGLVTYYVLRAIEGQRITGVRWDGTDPVLANAWVWFLFTLFVSSVLLLFAIQLKERFGFWAFAGVYIALLCVPCGERFYIYYIKWFYVFYAAGYLFNKYGMRWREQGVNKIVPVAVFILFLMFVSFWQKSDYIYIHKMQFAAHNSFNEVIRLLYRYAVGFLGIAAAFYAATVLLRTRVEQVLAFVGLYSLDIFLLQRYIVEGVYPRLASAVAAHFDISTLVVLGIVAPLLTAGFVYICIALSRALIRNNPLLNNLLLGARKA